MGDFVANFKLFLKSEFLFNWNNFWSVSRPSTDIWLQVSKNIFLDILDQKYKLILRALFYLGPNSTVNILKVRGDQGMQIWIL